VFWPWFPSVLILFWALGQARQAAQQAQDTAGQAAGQAQDAAGGAAQQAQDAAGQATEQGGGAQQQGEQGGGEQEPNATQAARQKAEELGVDLSEVEGSGSEGRITVKDVQSAANQQ
jgi:pyruvate/2-oxoglutarate dehydrogenase complex dihydrolipoamide acyltransferase (E2) component